MAVLLHTTLTLSLEHVYLYVLLFLLYTLKIQHKDVSNSAPLTLSQII
jgi:hypothetical protein